MTMGNSVIYTVFPIYAHATAKVREKVGDGTFLKRGGIPKRGGMI